jgi:hypothetical protein
MKKFDLKKMIAENKATFFSSLNEGIEPKYVAGSNPDIDDKSAEMALSMMTKEGKKQYYKDAEADDAEHIKALEKDMADDKKSSKMKVSELKAKIKEMVLAEMTLDVNDETSEVDFLAELEEMLNENSPMNDPRVEQIISMLKDLDVDGETMEYILRQVGMEDQMANQLVNYPSEYAASLNEAEGLTPLQQYIYDYEQEISGDDFANEELNNIKELNNLNDVYNYYANYRGWEQDKDFKYDLKNLMKTLKKKFENLNEADKDTEKDTAETDADVTVDDTETIDTETTTEVDPNVKAVQDALTQAQAAAQKLGDKKLMDQIGNTITFFTRTHVVEKPGGAVAEAMINDSDIIQIKSDEDLKKVGGKLIFKFDAEVKANDFDDGREYKVYILADDEETAKDIGMKKVRSAFLPKNLNSGFPQSTDKANNLWTGKESNSEWYGIKKAESMTEAMFPFLKLRLK